VGSQVPARRTGVAGTRAAALEGGHVPWKQLASGSAPPMGGMQHRARRARQPVLLPLSACAPCETQRLVKKPKTLHFPRTGIMLTQGEQQRPRPHCASFRHRWRMWGDCTTYHRCRKHFIDLGGGRGDVLNRLASSRRPSHMRVKCTSNAGPPRAPAGAAHCLPQAFAKNPELRSTLLWGIQLGCHPLLPT
jgi:hypothetical protein